MLGLAIDLDLVSDLVEDYATGLAVYTGVQLVLLAFMIAATLYVRFKRSPVERLIHRRHFGL